LLSFIAAALGCLGAAPSDAVANVLTCAGPFTGLGKPVLEIRGGIPAGINWESDWEFGLGTTVSGTRAVKGQHEWQSAAWLPFSLRIDARGSAVLTYGGNTLRYAAPQAGPIGVGNAVRAYVRASGTTPASSVAVRVTRINDVSGLNLPVKTSPTSTVFNDASLDLSVPAPGTSLRVDGEVQLNFQGTVPEGSSLGVTLTLGNCTPPTWGSVLRALEQAGEIPTLERSGTLEGIDNNDNGVRDDIEAFIDANYTSTGQRTAALASAMHLQEALLAGSIGDVDVAVAISKDLSRSLNCLVKHFPGPPTTRPLQRVVTELEGITANTKQRTVAYLDFNELLDGTTGLAPKGEYCEY
jgi:hypothetical protein